MRHNKSTFLVAWDLMGTSRPSRVVLAILQLRAIITGEQSLLLDPSNSQRLAKKTALSRVFSPCTPRSLVQRCGHNSRHASQKAHNYARFVATFRCSSPPPSFLPLLFRLPLFTTDLTFATFTPRNARYHRIFEARTKCRPLNVRIPIPKSRISER